MKTKIIKVDTGDGGPGRFVKKSTGGHRLDSWEVLAGEDGDQQQQQQQQQQKQQQQQREHPALPPLRYAAEYLRRSDTPVAFPTETVYGLGADATRSGAVRGIYAAKGRPSDNPLIVHVCDLDMLRGLLPAGDDIPAVYLPLLERFWPGPLTILLPGAAARLAPEVTAGLATFGARMPASPLALTLIKLAGAPLAAPSANASTRPSPTAARHVLDDLDGRVELILDGGRCAVGVESTVVDGLCDPPAVLRPGGVAIDDLRACPGWERVVKAYKDAAEMGGAAGGGGDAPRAPGMKYKHYSPRAKVVLYEDGFGEGAGRVWADLERGGLTLADGSSRPARLGLIRAGSSSSSSASSVSPVEDKDKEASLSECTRDDGTQVLQLYLGRDAKDVAQGLFAALRELDTRGADLICVEGVGDGDDIAAAVMNRLRKAATETR